MAQHLPRSGGPRQRHSPPAPGSGGGGAGVHRDFGQNETGPALGDVDVPVEMIGWIAPRVSSEIIPPSGPPFDAEVIAETARIHERAGFDRVLIGYFSDAPDGFLVGAHAASMTERLGFLLAHRPGFVAPPVAARQLATLDQLSDGRLAVRIIAGGSDADQAKDGDWTDMRPAIAVPPTTCPCCA